MVTTKLNLSMTEPSVRQIYAKQGDTGRVLDISLDQTPEDGTLRILRPDGVEVTSEAVTGGEVESGSSFESLTEADVTELTAEIEPVQDLNGYDKPWVGGAGKNLVGDSEFTTNATGNTSHITTEFSIPTTGATITASAHTADGTVVNTGNCAINFKDSSNVQLFAISPTQTKTAPDLSTATKVEIFTNSALANKKIYVQLEAGSSTSTWQPYSNICPITGHDEVRVFFGAEQGTADETYTTSLGQTVYGGTLDMVTGVLTVDRAIVDLGTLTWIRESIGDGNRFRTPLAGAEVADYPSHITALCSAYPLIEVGQTATKKQGFTIASNSNVYIYDGAQQSATGTDFKTAVTGTQLVYGLASPLTYTLTPQQIKTLVGTNNVWASSGDIVSIKFTYGGLLSELPSDATSVVGKCYCDVEQNGVSSMPFTLNVKKNERAT